MSAGESYVLEAPDGRRPLDATALENDLRNMWRRARGGDASAPGAVYRAALSNLVVPLDPKLSAKLSPVLVDVTRRHPSRLFSIEAGTAPKGARLRARVGALCHPREAGGGAVCSEQVLIDSDEESSALIPSAIRSLLIGDLPTVLLNFHPGPAGPWLSELTDMADLVVEDSCLKTSGAEADVWRQILESGSCRVHDLAWARLAPWRAILAEIFDDRRRLPSLDSVRAVELGFTGGGFPPPPAWLLAGWLASRLGWVTVGGDPHGLTFRSEERIVTLALRGGRPGEGRVLEQVRIRADAPHPLDLEVIHTGREPAALLTTRLPQESMVEVPFGYREFAACIVGEIHRHSANRPLEDAARAAEAMLPHWGPP